MNRLICCIASSLLLTAVAAAQVVTLEGPVPEKLPFNEKSAFLLQEGNAGFARSEGGVPFIFDLESSQEPVKNAPYTATAVTESTQTLLDGNHIVHKSTALLARDSQGRTRREETFSQMGSVHIDEASKIVMIHDPATHTDYILSPSNEKARVIKHTESSSVELKEALRKKLSAEGPGEPDVAIRKIGNGQEEEKVFARVSLDKKQEDLGVKQMEGVNCQSKRVTITIPAGAEGNERPMQIVSETCYSEELHAFVLQKHSDPRFGDSEYRLTNIKFGEPDPSLFQVPANYHSTTVAK